ncbi:unnamed protein product [Sphagnum compactum]
MALTPFFGSGRNGVFDPFDLGFWDPVDSWPSNFFGMFSKPICLVRLQKEDVKVTLEGDRTLQISGERTREQEKKTDTWHRVERSHGKFLRRFRLPDNANVESVNAKVENGVLTVTVPKAKKAGPEVRVVNID